MTEDQKRQKKENLIPKPIQRAFYAGIATGGFSVVFGMPIEYAPRIGLAGICYSLITDWQNLGPKKRVRRGRQIVLNGERTIDLEYSMSQGGYMARETWGDTLNRWVFGRGEASKIVKPNLVVPRPTELDEFIFISNGIQLREVHVKLFLKSAWRNRKYGKGLSRNRWVDRFSQRPIWYQELSTDWYFAVMRLLFNCQDGLKYQMVNVGANQWVSLANEPFLSMRLLKWYESERGK